MNSSHVSLPLTRTVHVRLGLVLGALLCLAAAILLIGGCNDAPRSPPPTGFVGPPKLINKVTVGPVDRGDQPAPPLGLPR